MKRIDCSLLLILFVSMASFSQAPFKGCPATGQRKTSNSNKAGKVPVREQGLNRLKNRDSKPSSIDHSVTLDTLIKAREEPDLNPNSGVEITAFVVSAEDGEAGESC